MSDPTKACIRVLRLEAKLRYILWYPCNKLFKLFEFLFQYINWCIVRSAFRWIGPVLLIYLGYIVREFVGDNPEPSQTSFIFVGGLIGAMVFVGCFVLISWVEVPYKEKEVINNHFMELSGEKK